MVCSVITQRILPSAHWWGERGEGGEEELVYFATLDDLGFS